MSYDTQCLDLAQFFLSDAMPPSPRAVYLAGLLAQDIQDAIESFFALHELDEKS